MSINLDIFKTLTKKQQLEALELLESQEANKCKESYFEFFKKAWSIIEPSTPLIASPHIPLVCAAIERQAKRQAQGLPVEFDTIIINIPPSCSKSSIVTKIFPAWVWLQKPSTKIINVSYNAALATSHSGKTRDLIQSDWYRKHFGDICQIKHGENNKTAYTNTAEGTRYATSTNAGITGFHAHIMITDDPINPKQADSSAELTNAKKFWEETMPSRLLENSFNILVMQRIHVNDPTGLELAGDDRILHVCLPAELDGQNDNVQPSAAEVIYQNGLLDPIRLPKIRLTRFKKKLGSYAYTGQYIQKPIPKGGGIIKSRWFQYIEEIFVPTGLKWNMWIDGAYTKSTSNDPTGIMVASFDPLTKNLYIKYFVGAYLEMPDLLREVPKLASRFNLNEKSMVYIEPKASGKSLKQLLNELETKLNAVEIRNKLVAEGKPARAQVASPKFEAGQVFFVKGNWTSEFEAQLTGFPAYGHDEAIDLMGYAVYQHYHVKEWTGQGF